MLLSSLGAREKYLASGVTLLVVTILLFYSRSYTKLEYQPDQTKAIFSSKCARVPLDAVTEVTGGIPGFYVFENLWFHNDSWYIFNPDVNVDFPDKDYIFTGPKGLEVIRDFPPDVAPDICLHGTTLMVHEIQQGGWTGLWHYYHFVAEDILGGFAALASARSPRHTSNTAHLGLEVDHLGVGRKKGMDVPDRIVIPWETNWHDKWGMNEMIINGVFDGRIIETEQWTKLVSENEWTYLERVTIVDRWTTHRHNPLSNIWNKMALPIFEQPLTPHFFAQARQKLLSHFSISSYPPPLQPGEKRVSKVIYIDRQGSDRKMRGEDHVGLEGMLVEMHGKGLVDFDDVVLEELGKAEQVEKVGGADIMIGIHGNGLTHQLWMPEESTLIELFPPGAFLRDYQTVARALGHGYVALCNDTVLTEGWWNDPPGEKGAGRIHDGTEIELDVPTLKRIIEVLLRGFEQ